MMEKKDKRIQKTEQQLKKALSSLAKEKSIKEISVSELSKEAKISRATFYLHYRDPHDMIEQWSNDLLNQLLGIIESSEKMETKKLFQSVFVCIKDNREIATLILHAANPLNFLKQIDILVRNLTKETFVKKFHLTDTVQSDYLLTFVIGGSAGIIMEWIQNDMKESTTKMGDLLHQAVMNGMAFMDEQIK